MKTEKSTMTTGELIKFGAETLKSFGIDDYGFDSRCLAQHILQCDNTSLHMNYSQEIEPKKVEAFTRLIERRVNGEPLQYILGEWEFMGFPFKVGRGVLIPRPETELLVEFAIDFLKNKDNPVVFDLCSGSGCIAISVAKLCPNATIYAVEKSDDAFEFLLENIRLNHAGNIHAVKGDIFNSDLLPDIRPDLILSNPPYIRSEEIESLQTEVKEEPVMALDGGSDGYDFYRIIALDWLKRIKKGGMLAVECAEEQTEYISELFSENAAEVRPYSDLSGLPRGVTAII